jgi:hypothetical protein
MGFLRRIFGGGGDSGDDVTTPGLDHDEDGSPEADTEERNHELDVLRAEAERMDELTRRQLKYAHYAWQPPPQGGEQRADDGD